MRSVFHLLRVLWDVSYFSREGDGQGYENVTQEWSVHVGTG